MCCKEGIPKFKKPHGTHGYVNAVIVSRNLPRATLETHVVFFKNFFRSTEAFFSSILQVAFNFSKQSWRFFSARSQEKTVGGIVSDTGRASSVVSRAHRGTAFSAEQLGTAQTWWFGSFQLCLVESPSFLLDCVKIMAIQLKCNLYKWCLLFANALALLLSLIAHQRHSMWLWLLNPWQQFNPPGYDSSLPTFSTVVVIPLWCYVASLGCLFYLEYIRSLYTDVTKSLSLYILFCYSGVVTGEVCLWKRSVFMRMKRAEDCEWRIG